MLWSDYKLLFQTKMCVFFYDRMVLSSSGLNTVSNLQYEQLFGTNKVLSLYWNGLSYLWS